MLDFDIFCLKLRRWELHRELEESGIYIPAVVQENGKKLYRELIEGMSDRHENIRRWYSREECVYINPQTREEVKVMLPHDYEAIYCFLKYCEGLDRSGELDPDFVEYLEGLLQRTQDE
ncbi:MAG: hypothetical protein IJW55_06800 [Clostridia bacterium]|nr:hypothetical protein [Clostridia bacterium]